MPQLQHSRDAHDARRVRFATRMLLAFMPLAMTMAVVHGVLGRIVHSGAFLITALLLGVAAGLVVRTRKLGLAAHVTNASLLLFITLLCLQEGGLRSPVLYGLLR